MKIVCGNCGAKYSIADEKVQGKVFKIRCRKCSHVIVVKGTADEAAGGFDDGAGYGGVAAEWYAVIDGEQVGPITRDDIEAYFTGGRLEADSYVWREGLAEWAALTQVEEFAHLFHHGMVGSEERTQVADASSYQRNQPSYEDDVTAAMTVGDSAGGGMAMLDSGGGISMDSALGSAGFESFGAGGSFDSFGGGGFNVDEDAATRDVGALAQVAASAPSPDEDNDNGSFSSFDSFGGGDEDGASLSSSGGDGSMFSAFDSSGDNSSFESFGGISSADAGAPADPNGANDMVGKRNENSVLFSLSSLDQIQAIPGGGEAPAADAPVTEGSGLIDIKNLAQSHAAMSNGAGGPDLGDNTFNPSTMAVPAIIPPGTHRNNTPLIVGGLIGAVVLLGLIGTVAYLLINKDDAPGPTVIRETKVIVEKGPESKGGPSEADLKKAEADAKAAEDKILNSGAVVADGDDSKDDDKARKGRRTTRRRGTRRSSKSDKSDSTPKATASTSKSKRSKKRDDIDAMLDNIGKDKKKKTTGRKSASRSNLPKSPGRSDVKNTIGRYLGRVSTCAKSSNSKKLTGNVFINFKVKPNGRTSGVSTKTAKFKGSDVAKCVEGVVRSMKFPDSQDGIPKGVTYPFSLR